MRRRRSSDDPSLAINQPYEFTIWQKVYTVFGGLIAGYIIFYSFLSLMHYLTPTNIDHGPLSFFTQAQRNEFEQLQREMQQRQSANVYVPGKCQITLGGGTKVRNLLKNCIPNDDDAKKGRELMEYEPEYLREGVRKLLGGAGAAAGFAISKYRRSYACFEQVAKERVPKGPCFFQTKGRFFGWKKDEYVLTNYLWSEPPNQYYQKTIQATKGGADKVIIFHQGESPRLPIKQYVNGERKADVYNFKKFDEAEFSESCFLRLTYPYPMKCYLNDDVSGMNDKYILEEKLWKNFVIQAKHDLIQDWTVYIMFNAKTNLGLELDEIKDMEIASYNCGGDTARVFESTNAVMVRILKGIIVDEFETEIASIEIDDLFPNIVATDKIGSGKYGVVYKYEGDKVLKILKRVPVTVKEVDEFVNEIGIGIDVNKKAPHLTVKLRAIHFDHEKCQVGLEFDDGGESVQKVLYYEMSEYYTYVREDPVKMLKSYVEQSITMYKALIKPDPHIIVHADVKPGNILMSGKTRGVWQFSFIDFGISFRTTGTTWQNVNLRCTFQVAPEFQMIWRQAGNKEKWKNEIFEHIIVPYPWGIDAISTLMNIFQIGQIVCPAKQMKERLTTEIDRKLGSDDPEINEKYYGVHYLHSEKDAILAQYKPNDGDQRVYTLYDFLKEFLPPIPLMDKAKESQVTMDHILGDDQKLEQVIGKYVVWLKKVKGWDNIKEKWADIEWAKDGIKSL